MGIAALYKDVDNFVSCSADATIRIWSLNTLEESLLVLSDHTGKILC